MICVGDALYVFGGCGASGRLNDLHKFDLKEKTWHNLGTSLLRGRGGPNLLSLSSGGKLAVVAGFAGEETNDGHVYDLTTSSWHETVMSLDDLRPRSVCIAASFPSVGVSVVFGGEVDPSQRGHEGAGGFANDVVLLDEVTGSLIETVPPAEGSHWPGPRGWSDGASADDGTGKGHLYVFGGLAGDDKNPVRLDDLWRLDLSKES